MSSNKNGSLAKGQSVDQREQLLVTINFAAAGLERGNVDGASLLASHPAASASTCERSSTLTRRCDDGVGDARRWSPIRRPTLVL